MEYCCKSFLICDWSQSRASSFQRQKSVVTPAWLRQSIKDMHPVESGLYAAFEELHDSESNQDVNSEPHLLLCPPQVRMKATPRRVLQNWNAKYACQRASPMVCVNQTLAAELNVLARSRELEGLSMNALSYEKSVGVWSFHSIILTICLPLPWKSDHKVQVGHTSVVKLSSSRLN